MYTPQARTFIAKCKLHLHIYYCIILISIPILAHYNCMWNFNYR